MLLHFLNLHFSIFFQLHFWRDSLIQPGAMKFARWKDRWLCSHSHGCLGLSWPQKQDPPNLGLVSTIDPFSTGFCWWNLGWHLISKPPWSNWFPLANGLPQSHWKDIFPKIWRVKGKHGRKPEPSSKEKASQNQWSGNRKHLKIALFYLHKSVPKSWSIMCKLEHVDMSSCNVSLVEDIPSWEMHLWTSKLNIKVWHKQHCKNWFQAVWENI